MSRLKTSTFGQACSRWRSTLSFPAMKDVFILLGHLLMAVAKLMGPLFDSLMGPDFEAGLAKLKQIVEAPEG